MSNAKLRKQPRSLIGRLPPWPLGALFLALALIAACGDLACGDDVVPDHQLQPTAAPVVSMPVDPTAPPAPTQTPEPSPEDTAVTNRDLVPPPPMPTAPPPPTPTPSATPTSTPTPTVAPVATQVPDLDCSDFDTWQEAQDHYLSAGGPDADPHRLDGDGDGVPCEDLPGSPGPEPTPTLPPASSPTPEPTPVLQHSLSADCVPGGDLDGLDVIATCNAEAMAQVETYLFTMVLGLAPSLSLVPEPEGADLGDMTITGAISLPDSMLFTLALGAGDFSLKIRTIMIGDDIYVKDPLMDAWLKDKASGPGSEGLMVVQQMQQLNQPITDGATLSGVVALEDGTMAYEISVEVRDLLAGSGDLSPFGGASAPLSTVLVGVDDFLTREIRVALQTPDGDWETLATINLHGFNDPVEIIPPDEYEDISSLKDAVSFPTPQGVTVVEPPRPPPAPIAILLNIRKDRDDNVRVTFLNAVYVHGVVELQVEDPDGRGWTLPLLEGSGTSELVFDASAPDSPPLAPGQSKVVGFVFLEAGSEIVDDNEQPAELDLAPWTYPASVDAQPDVAPWLASVRQNAAGSIVLTFTEGVNVASKSGLKLGMAPSGDLDLDSDFDDGSIEMKFCQPNGSTALVAGVIVAGFILPDGTAITDADGNSAQFAFQPYTTTATMEVATAAGVCG